MKRQRFWGMYALACASLVVFLALLLVGCATPQPNKIQQDSFVFGMTIDPELETLGRAEWSPGFCKIYLREYPACLLHELRHCIEGTWHGDRSSDWDC